MRQLVLAQVREVYVQQRCRLIVDEGRRLAQGHGAHLACGQLAGLIQIEVQGLQLEVQRCGQRVRCAARRPVAATDSTRGQGQRVHGGELQARLQRRHRGRLRLCRFYRRRQLCPPSPAPGRGGRERGGVGKRGGIGGGRIN